MLVCESNIYFHFKLHLPTPSQTCLAVQYKRQTAPELERVPKVSETQKEGGKEGRDN